MAYANLVGQSVADKAEAFCRMRDFICKRNGTYDYSATGIGWTLWDSSYAVDEDNPQLNDWFVIFSAGESGNDDLYFLFTWTSGYFKVQGYQAWDPSTHAGANVYSTGNNMTFAEALTNAYLYIYGDLNFLSPAQDDSGLNWHGLCFGKMDAPSDTFDADAVATCSSALTAGSDVSITVDAVPPNWKVGSELIIRTTHTNNTATVKAEVITVKTLVGNTITADLTNSYTADSKINEFLCYMCNGNTQSIMSPICFIDAIGYIGRSGGITNVAFSSSYYDPMEFEDSYLMNKIYIQLGATGWPIGVFPNMYVMPGWPAALANGDVFVDRNGDSWRVAYYEGNRALCMKEV